MSQLSSFLGSPFAMGGMMGTIPQPQQVPQNFGPPGYQQAVQQQEQQPAKQGGKTAASPTRGGQVPPSIRPQGFQNPAMTAPIAPTQRIGSIQGMQDVTPPNAQSLASASQFGSNLTPAAVLQNRLQVMQQALQPATDIGPAGTTTRQFDNASLAQYLGGGSVPNGTMLMREDTQRAPQMPVNFDQYLAKVMPMMPVAYTPDQQMQAAIMEGQARNAALQAWQHGIGSQQQLSLGQGAQSLERQRVLGDLALRQSQSQQGNELAKRQLALQEGESAFKYGSAGLQKQLALALASQPGATMKGVIDTLREAQRGNLFSDSLGSTAGAGGAVGGSPHGQQGPAPIGGHTPYEGIEDSLKEAAGINPSTNNPRQIGEFLDHLNQTGGPGFVQKNFPAIEQFILSHYGADKYAAAKQDPMRSLGARFIPFFGPAVYGERRMLTPHTPDEKGRGMLRQMLGSQGRFQETQ